MRRIKHWLWDEETGWVRTIYIFFYSRTYSDWSRFIHKRGYHYMPVLPTIDDPKTDRHWCQWCGLRGSKVSELGKQRALEALSNESIDDQSVANPPTQEEGVN